MSLLGFSQSAESQDQEQPVPSQEHISKFRAEIKRLLPTRQWTDDQIKQALGLHGNDTNDAVAFLLAEVDKQEPGTGMIDPLAPWPRPALTTPPRTFVQSWI